MNTRPLLVGYACVWNAISPYEDLCYGHTARFAPGAFTESIASDDIWAVWKHHWECPLAINSNWERRTGIARGMRFGILNLREDSHGLAVEIEPREKWELDSPVFREVRSGRVRVMSMEFLRLEGHFDYLPDDSIVYTITRAKLFEVSPVYSAAFPQTSIRLIEPPAPAEDASQRKHEIAGRAIGYQDVLRHSIRASRVSC